MTWFVGQKVWLVFGNPYAEPGYAELVKVGRLYVTTKCHRMFRKDNGYSKDSGRDRIYATKEEWELRRAKSRAWETLRRVLDYVYLPPKHLSTDEIVSITKRLKGNSFPWRHVKTGGNYCVIGSYTNESTMTDSVLYMSETGKLWGRPASEFYDGRFVKIGEGDKDV